MLQENKQVNGIGIGNSSTALQQAEWLDEVIQYLQNFKKQVSEGKVIVNGGYFDKTLNAPEKEAARLNELRLSVGYNEIK
ncbi:TPA: hypothetical protein ACR8OU_002073 [Enterococcus faecium]